MSWLDHHPVYLEESQLVQEVMKEAWLNMEYRQMSSHIMPGPSSFPSLCLGCLEVSGPASCVVLFRPVCEMV